MREPGAFRGRITEGDSPSGPARPTVSDAPAGAGRPSPFAAPSLDDLSPAQVHQLLQSWPEGCYPPDPDAGDTLGAASGVIRGAALGTRLWIAFLLII